MSASNEGIGFMTHFKRSIFATTASYGAMALMMLGAAPALAQDVPAADPSATAQPVPEEAAEEKVDDDAIVVTGFRKALQNAVNTKKRSDQIVESVSAEDIGKLPDSSIGESIGRLPGLATQRVNGRANVVAIRGFGPDFSQTTLNGREQTSTGDSRGVEFDQYPSEIVSRVDVYKSPMASLTSQGLVGTVDIRTVRPLDVANRVVAVGARGSLVDLGKLNADSKEVGFRANFAYIDKFADDRIGVALAASYVDEPYQQREYGAWGFFDPFGTGDQTFSGAKVFATSTQLQRLGLNGTFQAKLTDNLTVTADGFYSHFKDDQLKRALEMPVSWYGTNGNVADFTAEDGTYTSGVLRDVQAVVRNDAQVRKADLYSFGLNAAWTGQDGWSAMLDFGWSRTNRRELSIQSTAGTGYQWDNPFNGSDDFAASDPVDDIGFTVDETGPSFDPTLDYSDPDLILLTMPLDWGGNRLQAGYVNDRKVKDDLKQFRAELRKTFESSAIQGIRGGLSYIGREKSLKPQEFLLTLPAGQTEIRIPDQYLQDPTDLGRGLGGIVTYDPRDLIDAGLLNYLDNNGNFVLVKAFSVQEKLFVGYVQADINAQVGSAEITGNVGVQAVHTDQSSTGVVIVNGAPSPYTDGAKYWNFLPSLNLSARFPTDWVLRFAASKQMQRARLDQMRATLEFGVDTSVTPIRYSGSSGNPRLKPYSAIAFDFTIEKYFGSKGYVALQLFYKDINRYIFDSQTSFDYAGLPTPTGTLPLTTIGVINQPVNTKGGSLYGLEIGATVPFDIITPVLSGFGVTGGISYTKTKIQEPNGNTSQIPGYSKWVANGTLFYENGGFNARGSVRHRSRFLGDFVSYNGQPDRRFAVPETIVDGQVGYDFKNGRLNGLSIYLQGLNLTDSPFKAVNANYNQLQTSEYQTYGRRFLAGFTYKF